MKYLKNDVVLLLGFLLLFCFGLSFLRNDHKNALLSVAPIEVEQPYNNQLNSELDTKKPCAQSHIPSAILQRSRTNAVKSDRLSDLSTEQLLNYMQPLFMTKSASAIIAFLKHIPSNSVFRVVQAIVQDEMIHLPPRVKLRIIFAAAQRQKSSRERYPFFNLIADNKSLQKGAKPLLVKAVEAGYSHLVPDILSWSHRANIGDVAAEALLYAARHDDEDPEALRELFEAGVHISTSKASELLWELVGSCSEGYSVAFLIEKVRADTSISKSGLTVLMRAVQDGKVSVVAELLKRGIDPRAACSGDATKTALEIARETGNSEMEQILRGYGA